MALQPVSFPSTKAPLVITAKRATGNRRVLARVCRSILSLIVLLAFTGCDSGPSIEEVRALHRKGQFAESLEPLRELIDRHPDDSEINFRYGMALGRSSSSPVAVWALRKAAESPDWKVPAHLELAKASLRTASLDTVIESTTIVLEEDPDHPEALRLRGMTYLNAKEEPELARHDFERLLDSNPDDDAAKASLAAALLVLGEVEEAEQLLLEVEEFANDETQAGSESTRGLLCATRATLEAERHALETSEKIFEECLTEFPTNTIVIEQAVSFFDQTGKAERAEALLREAVAAMPGNTGFRNTLASRFVTAGNDAEAEALLKEGTTLPDPRTQAWAWTTLTNYYLDRNNIPSAIDSYQHAIALNPNPSQLALLTMADLLARGERHPEALEYAGKLENDAYRGLIEARVDLNEVRPAKALERLEQVFLSWPNNPGARYYAARAAEQLGDFERAIEEYRQSIRSDSKQTDAGLRLAKLYLESGSLQNAWNTASQYFRIHPEDPEAVRVLLRAATVADPASVDQLFKQLQGGKQWPTALSIRAGIVSENEGTEAALKLIEDAPESDITSPASVELLRTKVGLLLSVGRTAEAGATTAAALSKNGDFGPILEVQGLLLESTQAKASEVRAAYARAIEMAPRYGLALESLGRLEEREGHLEEALQLYRRAIEASPEQPSPGRAIATALEKAGRRAEAEIAWEEHLREHPWDGQAALALSRLRGQNDQWDDRTLQLAERSVLFQGREEALQLLIETHNARGETERAQAIAQAASDGKPLPPSQITPIDRL